MTGPDSPSRSLAALASALADAARRHDPSWTGGREGDPGLALLELQAWLGDVLAAYQDRIAAESALGTGDQTAAVSPFRGQTHRSDPYRNFKFRVKWDGRYIPGTIRVSPLGWRADVAEYRDGADPDTVRHLPGRIHDEAIMLEREVTRDTAFESWAAQVRQLSPGVAQAGAVYRHDVRIELVDPAARLVLAYDAYQCWPSAYRVVPQPDAAGGGTVVEQLTLVCEGWQRVHDGP